VHNIVVIVFVSTRFENLAREKYLGKGKQSGWDRDWGNWGRWG
jgi:hypothetical protein